MFHVEVWWLPFCTLWILSSHFAIKLCTFWCRNSVGAIQYWRTVQWQHIPIHCFIIAWCFHSLFWGPMTCFQCSLCAAFVFAFRLALPIVSFSYFCTWTKAEHRISIIIVYVSPWKPPFSFAFSASQYITIYTSFAFRLQDLFLHKELSHPRIKFQTDSIINAYEYLTKKPFTLQTTLQTPSTHPRSPKWKPAPSPSPPSPSPSPSPPPTPAT